jgi:uncharacterized protein with HEPN domain
MSREAFLVDGTTYRSVLFSLMKIGEASARLDKKQRARMAEIEWPAIVAFRNLVVHEYFALDPDVVWTIVTQWLEPLRTACSKTVGNRSNADTN